MEYVNSGSGWQYINGIGMNILQNNPYRLLGVYANSPTKERLANVSRIKAFLKVGKTVSFPLDLPLCLPAVNRNEATVADAGSKLTLPKDQILYAQFWFVKITQIDEEALNHLTAGEIADAENIWNGAENASSLQNQIVSALIRNKYSKAVQCAERLYSNPAYVSQLVSAVIGEDSGNIASEGLVFNFLDTLSDEIGSTELLDIVAKADWKKHITEKAISPIIKSIENAIATAKQSQGKDADARLKAGEILQKDTNSALQELRELIPSSDLKYQTIADKLGLTILQCGIDYFNGSNDPDAAFKAMKLQNYANGIVVGQMAKDRCKENVGILQEIIDNLPPKEVMSEYRAIQSYLRQFANQSDSIKNSIQLIKNCAPHLVAIKEKLGKNNGSYLKISTTIVNNALGNVISEVNQAQNRDFGTLKDTLIEAWHAILYMGKLDMDPQYKNGRYKHNRDTLDDIIEKCEHEELIHSPLIRVYSWRVGLSVDDLDLRTENETYSSCDNLRSLLDYVKRFPYGKYIAEAKSRIVKLRFEECTTSSDFKKFINDYPKSDLVAKAQEAINRIVQEEKMLAKCRTTDDVIALYVREKSNNGINKDRCSSRAFELSELEDDYRKVLSVFGDRTQGGQKAKNKLEAISCKRKEKRKKIIVASFSIAIPLLLLLIVYLIWGTNGLGTICWILAVISGLYFFGGGGGIIEEKDWGCLIVLLAGAVAFGLGYLGQYLCDL